MTRIEDILRPRAPLVSSPFSPRPMRLVALRSAALFLLTAAVAVGASAQPGGMPRLATVTGTVTAGDTGEPLLQATVAAYQEGAFVTGASTGLDGTFTLELRPGAYEVRVSYVGYETLTRDAYEVSAGPPADFGSVALVPTTEALDAAEVTAQREFVEQQADRTVYNVREQPVTAGGSVLETLQTLPSVEVDTDGNVSLQGNQNVVIQINGRPTPVSGAFLAALLRQISSEKVEKVEVLPNPSAKFDADGMGGIINIVLAEGTDRGLSGGLTLGGGTNPEGNVGANLSYQRGTWDLNGSYGYRYGQNDQDNRSFLFSPLRTVNQVGLSDGESQSHFFNGSAAYILGQGTDLTLEGSFGVRSNQGDGRTVFDNTLPDGEGGTVETNTIRETDSDNDGLNGDLALIYRKRFQGAAGEAAGNSAGGGGGGWGGRFGGTRGGGGATSDHELAVEARVTRNDSDDFGLFEDLSDPGFLVGSQRSTTDQTNDEATFQVDYTRPLGVTKLETGLKLTAERVANDLTYERMQDTGQFEVDAGQTNAFEYDRQIGAAYVQAARPLGPLQVQAGLRLEAAARSFDLLTDVPALPGIPAVSDADADQSYADLFPSVFATLPLGEAGTGTLVKASYRRSINRPRTFFLNPFPSFEDTTFIRVGNPQLTPEYTNKVDLTFTYKYFLTISPFYSRTTDVISRRVFEQDGVRTFTSQNLDTEDSYGTDVTIAASLLGGDVRGFVNGSAFREVLTESTENTVDGLSWRVSANLSAKLFEGTNVQGFYFYRGPSNIINGRREGFGFGSIGVSQKISDQLSLSVRANDPFGTGKFAFETDSGVTRTESEFNPNLQQISATLTYTFGSNQQRRPQRNPQEGQGGMDNDGFGI